MPDRPAAELLDTYGPGSDFAKTWGEGMQAFIVGLIERVARAEQALADIERRCQQADRAYERNVQMLGSTSGAGYAVVSVETLRAALRASQETDHA